MANFQVLPNDLIFRHTNHKHILKFTGGTTVSEIGKHDIQHNSTNCTPFDDISFGKWQKHLLKGISKPLSNVFNHFFNFRN